MNDLETLKVIGGSGLAFYVIKELFKFIYLQHKQKKEPAESLIKERSRELILTTNETVKDIELRQKARDTPFFNIEKKVETIHDIVTRDHNGTPLVYNAQLNSLMQELNTNMQVQNKLLEKLLERRP